MLLGIHTALKDDLSLQCTMAELVYGTTLCLPHEFFTTTSNFCDDPASYVTRLKAMEYKSSETNSSLHAAPEQHILE